MKQKIKEALKQKYGTRANKELGQLQLGIGDEVFERVAASVETLITDESAIESFVNSENTLNLLKSYQSVNDRLRAAEAKNEPTPKPSDNGNNNPEPKPEVKPQDTPDIADIVAKAVAAAINPLQEKLTAFETANAQKSAVAALDELRSTWDYAKGYPAECEDAYERVMELYEVSGKKWTADEELKKYAEADELKAKFTEKFNKAVSKKGVDTTKPFESDGAAKGDDSFDSDYFTELYKDKVAGEKQPD